MDVQSIMTPNPLSVGPDTSLDDALSIMDEYDIRHLPVMNNGALAGIVSDRDLLEAVGWLPPGVHAEFPPEPRPGRRPVRAIMHQHVRTISPHTTVVDATLEFGREHVGCLPVVDGNVLMGIVTETDMMRAFTRACVEGNLQTGSDPTVHVCATRPAVTITFDMGLSETGNEMLKRRIRHLPVIQDGELVGVVSDRDVRGALSGGAPPDLPAGKFMSRYPVTIHPDRKLSTAADLMVTHAVSCLPVLKDGELVGVLTSTDVLNHCIPTLNAPSGT